MSVIRRAVKTIASIAVIVAATAAVALGAEEIRTAGSVKEQNVRLAGPRVTPGGPIISATGLREGDTRSAEFTVENPNSVATKIHMRGRLTAGNPDLYDAMTASLHSAITGTPIWSGRLRDLDTGRFAGEIAAGNGRRYSLSIGVPSWAGNNLQSLRNEFDLDFNLTLDGAENDTTPPVTSVSLRRSTRVRTRRKFPYPVQLSFTGYAGDDASDIARVEMSLVRYSRPVKVKRGRVHTSQRVCRSWLPLRRKFIGRSRGKCKRFWITARGGQVWRYRFARHRLRPGRYELRVRSIDAVGNVEKASRRRGKNINVIRFRVKR